MKTPRDILLQRHAGIQSKLDAIRKEAVIGVVSPTTKTRDSFSLVEFLLSLRWHLSGAGAAWVLVLLLNTDAAPGTTQKIASEGSPSSMQLLAALQEHRRQLLEWEEEPGPALENPDKTLPPRRSEVQSTNFSNVV
jgi:hypothetical protein